MKDIERESTKICARDVALDARQSTKQRDRETALLSPLDRKGSLFLKELSRADYPTTVRALAHQGQKTRTRQIRAGILRKAAVKTTWVESLGQDSSLCWTDIENFNLCEKFDKNTF